MAEWSGCGDELDDGSLEFAAAVDLGGEVFAEGVVGGGGVAQRGVDR